MKIKKKINIFSTGNGDKDDEDKADQGRKRQRLNSEDEAGQSTSNNLNEDANENDNENDVESENQFDATPNRQPRRRLLRGRAFRARANQMIDETPASVPIDATLNEAVESEQQAISETPADDTNADDSNATGESASSSAQIDGVQIPEGIDPSFLAALPEEMRDEVIAEHLRIQRMQERTRIQQQVAVQNEQQAVVEVNPEFLAALPPNIQEEVLAQQRIEQQRLAAAAANPNDPVDAAAFFQNLQP